MLTSLRSWFGPESRPAAPTSTARPTPAAAPVVPDATAPNVAVPAGAGAPASGTPAGGAPAVGAAASLTPAVGMTAVPPAPAPDERVAVLTAALTEELRARGAALLDAADARDVDPMRVLVEAVTYSPVDAVRQLPSAAREALSACDDPRAGVAALAKVCEGDIAVAQALLRYANSSLVARAGQTPAASLREAIDRVGSAGVRNVVMDVTVGALLCAPGSRHATYTAQIWTHAQRTAALARAVARAFGAAPDRAYTAALLHDVGKLVVLDGAAALAADRSAKRPFAAPAWPALRALLVGLHEPLGALAMLRWGMGVEAAVAVGSHHRAPPPPAADAIGETVYLAERIDIALARGEGVDLAAWWEAGALTGSRERAAELVEAHLGPLAAAAAA